jgi:hypothetical protein
MREGLGSYTAMDEMVWPPFMAVPLVVSCVHAGVLPFVGKESAQGTDKYVDPFHPAKTIMR